MQSQTSKVSQLIGFFNSKSTNAVNGPPKTISRPANITNKQISLRVGLPNKVVQSKPQLVVKEVPRKTLLSSVTSSSSRTSLTSSDSSPKLVVQPPIPGLFVLPNEILVQICLYLTKQELCELSQINKPLNAICSSGTLWLPHFKSDFEASSFSFYSETNQAHSANWRTFYISAKSLWRRVRLLHLRSKRDMFVSDSTGEMLKLQPFSAIRESNHALKLDDKSNCYGFFFHWNIEKKVGILSKWGLDFIEQKSKPSYYVFSWRKNACEQLFEEPSVLIASPKQTRLLVYSPKEGWYCINTKKMTRTNLPNVPATLNDAIFWIDERKIVFTSQSETNTAIFIYNTASFVVEKIAVADYQEIIAHKYMAVSPKTQELALVTKGGLMKFNLRTEKWSRLDSKLSGANLKGPLLYSPSGTKIAYVAMREGDEASNFSIFVYDVAKNKEFVLNRFKGAKRVLGWHGENSFIAESAATFVTYSLIFVDTALELANDEPFYFSRIINKNMKVKAVQMGSVQVEIVI